MKEWEAQIVREILTQWESKNALVYWNPVVNAWEVNGKRFEDKDTAIASEARDGWQLSGVMEDGWVALPAPLQAAGVTRAETTVYHAFYQRRKH